MSKIKHIFRGRKWLRNLVTILLCLVVVGGVVGGVVALIRNTDKIEDALTYKSYGWTHYRVGGLDGSGNYMSTDQSIYTKDAFECQGLNVTPVFDNDISYQIYFYDQNNEFVHTTGRLTGTFVQDSVPFFAKYARIVVTPNDDNKVTIFEIAKYAKQIETNLYREQGFKNYTENLVLKETEGYLLNGSHEVVSSDVAGACISNYIKVSLYGESLIFRTLHPDLSSTKLFCYDNQKTYLGNVIVSDVATLVFTTSEGINYYSIPVSSLKPSGASEVASFIRISGSDLPEIHCR